MDRANRGAEGCLWADEHFDTPVGDAPLQVRASDIVIEVVGTAELRHSMPIQGRHDCFAAYRAHCRAVAPTTTTTVRSRSKQDPNAADVIVVVVAVVAKALK